MREAFLKSGSNPGVFPQPVSPDRRQHVGQNMASDARLLLVADPSFGNKAVADPGFGLNVLLAGLGFELLP